MNRLVQTMPLILAALLQLMPLLRNIIANPATGSTMAFILRWGVGAGATIGAYDTVSGASAFPVRYTSPTNFIWTAGIYSSNSVTITNNQEGIGAFFGLTNKFGTISPTISNGIITTNCLPNGLFFKCYDANNGNTPIKPIWGAIYGNPTTPVTNYFVHVLVGYHSELPIETNIYITILPASGTPPSISVQPVGVTNVAGSSPSFSVTASGTPSPAYQWRLANANLAGANATALALPNVRGSQTGNYTVVITNSAGAITSSIAILAVTNPLPTVLTAPAKTGGNFQFTFIPTIGLTNTVQANGVLNNSWTTFSNLPPPASATPVTITDVIVSSNRFYRVLVQP